MRLQQARMRPGKFFTSRDTVKTDALCQGGIYGDYLRVTAEKSNRNLLTYGSETHRGRQKALWLLGILAGLGTWLGALSNVSPSDFGGLTRT